MESVSPHMENSFLMIGGIFLIIFFLISLLVSIFMVFVWCKIFFKTGYHWAMGLLMFIPIANIVMPIVLAFTQWPLHKELEAVRRGQFLNNQTVKK